MCVYSLVVEFRSSEFYVCLFNQANQLCYLYDIWGNTVNVASRMESTGELGKIQVKAHLGKPVPKGEGTSQR